VGGDLAQDAVAGRVAEAVVDRLEGVDVGEAAGDQQVVRGGKKYAT
jgi:hypothetical protein